MLIVPPVDGEGGGTDAGLEHEPPLVLFAVDDVNAADQHASGEQAHDTEEDEEGAARAVEVPVSEARERAGEEACEGLEALVSVVVTHWCGLRGMGSATAGRRRADIVVENRTE